MTGHETVVIRSFINVFDAEAAKTALDAAGIESVVQADDAGGMHPHLQVGGVRLSVHPDDAERAEQVLTAEAEVLEPDEDEA